MNGSQRYYDQSQAPFYQIFQGMSQCCIKVFVHCAQLDLILERINSLLSDSIVNQLDLQAALIKVSREYAYVCFAYADFTAVAGSFQRGKFRSSICRATLHYN